METTYKYTGDQEVHVSGIGVVKPGETIKTVIEVNNPLFVEVKSESQKKRIDAQVKEK